MAARRHSPRGPSRTSGAKPRRPSRQDIEDQAEHARILLAALKPLEVRILARLLEAPRRSYLIKKHPSATPKQVKRALQRLANWGLAHLGMTLQLTGDPFYYTITRLGRAAVLQTKEFQHLAGPGGPNWIIRMRTGGWLEAHCIHGVGHSLGIHGCDACCHAPDFPMAALLADEQIHAPAPPRRRAS